MPPKPGQENFINEQNKDDDDPLGCFLLIGIACLALGAGYTWGPAIGLMTAGAAILLSCVIYRFVSPRRRR
jgi:hypothetical protein